MYLYHFICSLALLVALWMLPSGGSGFVSYTEDCENGKDDDQDGLIDLNDPDCSCTVAEPVSLIPNPSFEEQNCCPSNRSQLGCAGTWIQASEATTDYIHTCGWMGWDNLPPPLPFPDGQACVGFRDGRFGNNPEPNWKEYTGACLNSPLKAGTTYRFKFHIGFTYSQNSPSLYVTFFGTTDCANLPFGQGNSGHGCPTNGTGWVELGKVWVSGTNQWLEYSVTFTPTQDIQAIAIGPDCTKLDPSRISDTYYFFDNLILDDRRNFEYKITPQDHPCSPSYALQVPEEEGLTYQWYKDGVALVGQTQPALQVNGVEGKYQAILKNSNSCWLTPIFKYEVPVLYADLEAITCPNEAFEYHGKRYYQEGTYSDTLSSIHGCDSIVTIRLTVAPNEFTNVDAKIFKGEQYKIGKLHFKEIGSYKVDFQSIYGCDSIVQLNLDHYRAYFPNAFSPNGDNNNDRFTIYSNSDLKSILSLQIFDRWGEVVYDKTTMSDEDGTVGWDGTMHRKPAPNGVYIYTTTLLMSDNKERTYRGTFLLMR